MSHEKDVRELKLNIVAGEGLADLRTKDVGQDGMKLHKKKHHHHNDSSGNSSGSGDSSNSSGSENNSSESSGSGSGDATSQSSGSAESVASSGNSRSNDSSGSSNSGSGSGESHSGSGDSSGSNASKSSGSESITSSQSSGSSGSSGVSFSEESSAGRDNRNKDTGEEHKGRMMKNRNVINEVVDGKVFHEFKDYVAEVNNQTADVKSNPHQNVGGNIPTPKKFHKAAMKAKMGKVAMMGAAMMGNNCVKQQGLIGRLSTHVQTREKVGEKSPSLQDAKELLLILQVRYANNCQGNGMMMNKGSSSSSDSGMSNMMMTGKKGMNGMMMMGGGGPGGPGPGPGMSGGPGMGGGGQSNPNMMKMKKKMMMTPMMKMMTPAMMTKMKQTMMMMTKMKSKKMKSQKKSKSKNSKPKSQKSKSQSKPKSGGGPGGPGSHGMGPKITGSSSSDNSSFVPFSSSAQSSANGSLRARLQKRKNNRYHVSTSKRAIIADELKLNKEEELPIFDVAGDKPNTPSLSWWWPSPPEIINRMFTMANLKEGETVFDLGCGDGRIPVQAATKWGCTGVGVDFDENLCRQAKKRAIRLKVEDKVEIRHGDALKVNDIERADVVTLYILDRGMRLIKPILQSKLKKGARIVSHNYKFKNWEPVKEVVATDKEGHKHWIYLYVV
jgi:16S rRNA G966 N2-methylase RsmD